MAYECYKGTPPYYDLDDYQALSMITRDGVEPLIKKLSSATELFRKFLTRYVGIVCNIHLRFILVTKVVLPRSDIPCRKNIFIGIQILLFRQLQIRYI